VLPAASAAVVLEAGALDATGVDAAACAADVVAADGDAEDVTAVGDADADAEAAGFGEFPPQATTSVAVSATAKTERFETKRSDDVGTGLLCMAIIHPKTPRTRTRLCVRRASRVEPVPRGSPFG
jgi:hypothetical protein